MISNVEYIRLFITRSLEKDVDELMLADKNYIVPKEKMHEYVDRALAIPYGEYIDYIRNNKGIVTDEQLTQSSAFDSCSSEMCKALDWQGNPGLSFVEIGQLFPQKVRVKNEGAFRKYGENQVKTSTQLGLTFEYYGYWYLTCVGYIYNELEPHIQKSLLARTILRIPLYQTILAEIIEKDVELTKYMGSLSDTTIGRRSGSILKMINLCLDECRKEGVSYHNLFYPYYKSSTKQLLMGIQEGFDGNSIHELDIDFSCDVEKKRRVRTTEAMLKPHGSILYDVEADEEVRILVHNMMELYDGTTIMQIALECQKKFQQKYFSMKTNDWLHLLRDYVRKVTGRPNLQEQEVFRYVMAG